MKLWFFSSNDSIILMLLMFPAVFCNQDLSTETNVTAISEIMEIPCSLDDTEGNGTDCRNTSQIPSRSSESWRTSSPNSNEDVTTTLCPPDGCSISHESEANTSDSLVSIPNNFSKTDNSTENTVITKHFAVTTTTNETVTSMCPPEGCSMSNTSESVPITLPNENYLTENTEISDAVVTVVSSNETFLFENYSTYRSVPTMEGINETSLFDMNEFLGNSSFYSSGNGSTTGQSINTSATPTELPKISSNSSEDTLSEESPYSENSLTNTTHLMEDNGTVTDQSFYTELNLFNTSDHISEVNNSTETLGPFINLHNITGEENNASTTRPKNESLDITEVIVENITTDSFLTTSPEMVEELTTNVTSGTDDSTPFYTILSSSNISDSMLTTPVPTEESFTDFSTDTSSDSLADTTTTEIPELPSLPSHRMYIVVELQINCSGNRQEKEIALSMAQLLNATLKDNYNKECNNLHNVTLSILKDSVDFATVHRLLSKKIENAKIIRVIHDGNSANITSKNVTISDSDVTESEMILYITLGVCLGAVFFIALAIICFKCFRRRPSKPIDLDVPHLNLRLEDYTLTRIPRPNTVYLDYFRGPIVSDRYSAAPLGNSMSAASESDRGMVQPFDTSVVPLEDAKKLDQLATSPSRTSCPSTPLRTFGRKDWKRGDNLIYENVISSSTEKLHPDFYSKYGYPGMENPTFAA